MPRDRITVTTARGLISAGHTTPEQIAATFDVVDDGSVADQARASMARRAAGGDLPAGFTEADLANPNAPNARDAGTNIGSQFVNRAIDTAKGLPRFALDALSQGRYSESQGEENPMEAQVQRGMDASAAAAQQGDIPGVLTGAAEALPPIGATVTAAKRGDVGGVGFDLLMASAPGLAETAPARDAMSAAKGKIAGMRSGIRDAAIARLTKYFDSRGHAPDLAAKLATQVVDKRITMTNPRAEVPEVMKQNIKEGGRDLRTAVAQAPAVDAAKVREVAANTKAELYNQSAPRTLTEQQAKAGLAPFAPLDPDADAIAAKIDELLTSHVDANALNGEIDPAVALKIKQKFDKKGFGKDAITAQAQQAIANAMREQLNASPDVAAANKGIAESIDIKKELGKKVPQGAPLQVGKRLTDAAVSAAIGGTIGEQFGHGGAGAAAGAARDLLSLARDIKNSAQFKTWGAGKQAAFGEAMAAGNPELALKVAARASQGAFVLGWDRKPSAYDGVLEGLLRRNAGAK